MRLPVIPAVLLLACTTPLQAFEPGAGETFSRYVDEEGNISLPEDVRRNWSHLGSWVVDDTEAPGHGFHDVYVQPQALTAYLANGHFPDGAILVKEIRTIQRANLTTGQAEWAEKPKVWFVMIKDRKARFADSPHWGGGWGWALFDAQKPGKNVSRGWREECLACHVPAKANDYVFIEGYPSLKTR